MRKLPLILLLGLLAVCRVADATVVQNVFLKNGAELRGYIKQMNMHGGFIMATESVEMCLDGDEVTIEGRQALPESSLDEVWVKWAEENDAFDGEQGNRTLTLHDLRMKDGKSISKVKVIEMGVTVRYVELAKNEYEVNWSDVIAIRSDKRPKDALSGIDRNYELVTGDQYEGQYAGETSSTLSLYLSDGIIRTFNTMDVIRYTYTPINPNQTLFKQSPLIDIIVTRDGNETSGVIIEENYSSNDDNVNYILLQEESDKVHKFKLAEIAQVRKEENEAYDPQYDIVLHEGEVMVNRKMAEYCGITETDDDFRLDDPSQILSLKRGNGGSTQVTVEYRDINYQEVEMFQLVKAGGMDTAAKSGLKFSFKDLSEAYQAESVEISFSHVTKAEYLVDGEGVYILYNADKSMAIPFIIK